MMSNNHHINSSPMRSSFDNLAGVLLQTAPNTNKNSLIIPHGSSTTKASAIGSKKNSIHKVMLSDFVESGQNVNNILKAENNNANLKSTLKSRKNS